MEQEQLRFGFFGPYDDNELELVSNISDPVKVRLAVEADKLAGNDYNLGAVTGNLRRPDGRHEEYGGYRIALAPNRKGGALRLFVRSDDGREIEVGYLDEHNVVFSNLRVPNVTRMWAPDGLSFTQQQSDGNFVTYTTKVPFSIAAADVKAVWSAWTGRL